MRINSNSYRHWKPLEDSSSHQALFRKFKDRHHWADKRGLEEALYDFFEDLKRPSLKV